MIGDFSRRTEYNSPISNNPLVRTVLAVAMLSVLVVRVTSDTAEPYPQDLIVDGALGVLIAQSAPRICPELSAGTAGTPELEVVRSAADEGNGLAAGHPTTAPADLPEAIHLRSTTATFNRRYWFVLRDGQIYFKSNAEQTAIEQPWAPLPTPGCFAGDTRAISVDDDELIAIDSERQIFTMDGALGDPALFNWTVRWGPLFWTGGGRALPPGEKWSWSVSSPIEDVTFTDPAGNAHTVGSGKVSHIWQLSRRGQRLTYMDPWLPSDESYEMCAPHRGRLRSRAISASGSTVFVINRFGDMFTRLYDFDISGHNSFFLDYAYEDQRGLADPLIQIPAEPWKEQPKIPGRITSSISIAKRGTGSVHRTLRVEGRRGGRAGYWEKDVVRRGSRAWRFVATGDPLSGRPLANSGADTSGRGLGSSEDAVYEGEAGEITVRIANFNVYCTPARLRVELAGGTQVDLTLHTTDDVRQSPRARGLDNEPRLVNGSIEAPRSVLASRDRKVRAFVERYLTGGQFTPARIDATRAELSFPEQDWILGLVWGP